MPGSMSSVNPSRLGLLWNHFRLQSGSSQVHKRLVQPPGRDPEDMPETVSFGDIAAGMTLDGVPHVLRTTHVAEPLLDHVSDGMDGHPLVSDANRPEGLHEGR